MVILNIHPEIDFLIVEKADKQAETTAWENVNKNSHGSLLGQVRPWSQIYTQYQRSPIIKSMVKAGNHWVHLVGY